MLWCVSCPALADYGVSHALPWYPAGILWVCSGMSHGLLCPDDVLCKDRPCPNFTLWILSIYVNLELIYEFIYTCQ